MSASASLCPAGERHADVILRHAEGSDDGLETYFYVYCIAACMTLIEYILSRFQIAQDVALAHHRLLASPGHPHLSRCALVSRDLRIDDCPIERISRAGRDARAPIHTVCASLPAGRASWSRPVLESPRA